MSAVDERVAHIRMFTVPRRSVEVLSVYRYAAVAADWERLRLRVRRDPLRVSAANEQYSATCQCLRELSAALGLTTCTATTAGADGIAGITDERGMLPNDPGYLYFDTWFQSTESWCGE
jgi:hypothetical protein